MSVIEKFIKSGVDPFAEDPLPTAYYHPSLERKLKKEEKKICLSPERPIKLKASETRDRQTDPSPGAEKFLQKNNFLLDRELPTHDTPSPRDTSSKFNESWASSERPSTIITPEHDTAPSMTVPSEGMTDLLASTREILDEFDQRKQVPQPPQPDNSTLARYIHRFRYGEPKSREERQKENEKKRDFWWLSPPDKTSTVDDVSPRGRTPRKGQRNVTKSPRTKSPRRARSAGKKSLASTTSGDTSSSLAIPMYIQGDRLTLDLQDRAQRLLEKSDSLSEPRVSSEGLGSTSATTSTYQDPGSSQVYQSIQDKENVPRYSIAQGQSYRPRAKLAPEDDILYQWRLRRKLEVARQQSIDPTRPILGSGRRSPPVKLSPQKSKDWTADDDVDTKLSEFRQRMAQQRDLAGIHLANRQPVKTSGKDRETENKGIDPIPQSIATQTSPREDQTTTCISNQQNEHRVENTASEQRHDSPPTRLYRTPVKQKVSEHSQPPIASPHIHHCDESGDENEVTPHLHLMCDLLPCPHQVTGEGSTQITPSPTRSHKAAVEKPTASTSREGLKFTEHASPSKASKQLDFEDRGEDEGKYTSGDTQTQGTEKMKKTKLPTGRDVQATTSTPKTVPGSPISTAIGQVVGSRLFTSPHKSEHSSPRSSMDSLPTMQSTQRQVEDDTVVMSSSESDEDREDDDLLKLLYRNRTHYEDQLKHIDQLLAEKLHTN